MSVGSCVLDGVTSTMYIGGKLMACQVFCITIECSLNGFTQSVDFYTHMCTCCTSLQNTHWYHNH